MTVKLYQLRNDDYPEIFVGTTTQDLNRRFNQHKNKVSGDSKPFFDSDCKLSKGNVRISEIEDLGFISQKEASYILDDYVYRYAFICVNKTKDQIESEKMDKQSILMKKYYIENKQKHKEKVKEYQKTEKRQDYLAKYKEEHKEEIKEKQKEYRDGHKEELKEKSKAKPKKEVTPEQKEKLHAKAKRYRDANKEKEKARHQRFLENKKLAFD